VTILLWLAFICSFTGHYFITLWMPTVLTDDGFSDAQANSAMGLFQFGGAIGSFLIAFLLDKLGIRVVALTFLVTAPIVAALGLHTSYGVLLPHMLIAGLGVLGGQIGLNALAGTIYPTYMRAMGAGWGLGIGRIGSLAGPILGGYLLAMGIPRPTCWFSPRSRSFAAPSRFTRCISPSVPGMSAAARCRSPRVANSPIEQRRNRL